MTNEKLNAPWAGPDYKNMHAKKANIVIIGKMVGAFLICIITEVLVVSRPIGFKIVYFPINEQLLF